MSSDRWRPPATPPFAGALLLGAGGVSRREVFAGITLAALALPLNIGYATAAGLPATLGIYATLAPLVVFAVTTGSRHLVVGPDATIAALLAAVIGPIVARGTAPEEVASAMALCVGCTLLLFWLFRLGGLVRFVSKPVLVGFIAGLGIEVLTSQVRKIMNVEVDAEGWLLEVLELAGALSEVSLPSVFIGVVTLIALRLFTRWAPRLPGALVVLTIMTTLVAVLDPDDVAVLGEVPSGLPTPTLPIIGLDVWLDLVAVAVAIAVLTTAEGLLVAQRYARRNNESLDPNGEVFAMGVSNVVSALSGAMPIGASASRSAAMFDARSRTQVPSVVAAVVVAVVVLFFTEPVGRLPEAALAALVANAVISTIEVAELRRVARLRRSELVIAVGCAAGVLLIGPVGGIVLAVLVSAVDVVRRQASAPWSVLRPHDGDASNNDDVGGRHSEQIHVADTPFDAVDGLIMMRPGGSLFFANADHGRSIVERAGDDPQVRWLVIDLETVADIDTTAADAILDGIERAHATSTVVAFARATERVRELLDRYGITQAVGSDRIYSSNRAARVAYENTLR